MYTVLVKGGDEKHLHPHLKGDPAFGDAANDSDVEFYATPDHDCAMHLKRTLENQGRFLRREFGTDFTALLQWAMDDAKLINANDASAVKVAKHIWTDWLHAKPHAMAHKRGDFSDDQWANLAMRYINRRGGAFLSTGAVGNLREVEPLLTPVGLLYRHGEPEQFSMLADRLTPTNIRVQKVSNCLRPVEWRQHGDSRFTPMRVRPHHEI